MNYPLILLPNSNKKLIDCSLDDYCLVRNSRFSQKDLLDEFGKLKNEVIAEGADKVLPDYSTSLFGIFELFHINIKVTNLEYQEYCAPNFEVETPIYGDDFIIVEDRSYWSIMINKINNQRIYFEDNSLNATCKVNHTPMKWNFWHFSIHWYIEDIEEYWHNSPNYQTKSIRRKLATEARSLLKEFGKSHILSKAVIPATCFSV